MSHCTFLGLICSSFWDESLRRRIKSWWDSCLFLTSWIQPPRGTPSHPGVIFLTLCYYWVRFVSKGQKTHHHQEDCCVVQQIHPGLTNYQGSTVGPSTGMMGRPVGVLPKGSATCYCFTFTDRYKIRCLLLQVLSKDYAKKGILRVFWARRTQSFQNFQISQLAALGGSGETTLSPFSHCSLLRL